MFEQRSIKGENVGQEPVLRCTKERYLNKTKLLEKEKKNHFLTKREFCIYAVYEEEKCRFLHFFKFNMQNYFAFSK